MAESPESAIVLHNLLAKAKPAAQKEFVDLQAFAKETDGSNN
jgi:peptidyl-dipeptidase Dcp